MGVFAGPPGQTGAPGAAPFTTQSGKAPATSGVGNSWGSLISMLQIGGNSGDPASLCWLGLPGATSDHQQYWES